LEGIGDQIIRNGETVKLGAGGHLGGVRLAVSNEEVQKRNQIMLKSFLKKEAKKRKQKRKEVHDEDKSSTKNIA